jgi:hypothetical protein
MSTASFPFLLDAGRPTVTAVARGARPFPAVAT